MPTSNVVILIIFTDLIRNGERIAFISVQNRFDTKSSKGNKQTAIYAVSTGGNKQTTMSSVCTGSCTKINFCKTSTFSALDLNTKTSQ